jgi:hypothetical protein
LFDIDIPRSQKPKPRTPREHLFNAILGIVLIGSTFYFYHADPRRFDWITLVIGILLIAIALFKRRLRERPPSPEGVLSEAEGASPMEVRLRRRCG